MTAAMNSRPTRAGSTGAGTAGGASEEALGQIRICAFCPNPCRQALPVDDRPQWESLTPSAMAYLALAVEEGFLEADEEVHRHLDRLEFIRPAVGACIFGYDICAAIGCLTGKDRE